MKRLFTSFLEVRDHGEDHDTDGNNLAGASGIATTWGNSLGAYLLPVVSSSVVESGSSLDVSGIVRGRGIAHLALDGSITVSNGASSWEGVALGLVLLEHESSLAGGALTRFVVRQSRTVCNGGDNAVLVSGIERVSCGATTSLTLTRFVVRQRVAVSSGGSGDNAVLVSGIERVSISATTSLALTRFVVRQRDAISSGGSGDYTILVSGIERVSTHASRALSRCVSDTSLAVSVSSSSAGLGSHEGVLVIAGGAFSGREGNAAVGDWLDADVLGLVISINNNKLVSTSGVAAGAVSLSVGSVVSVLVVFASGDGGSSDAGSGIGGSEDSGSNALLAVLGGGVSGGGAVSALILGALTSGKGGSGEHESDSNKFSSQLHFFR